MPTGTLAQSVPTGDIDPAVRAKRRGLMRDGDVDPRPNRGQVLSADEEGASFLSVETLRRQFTDYLTNKVDEIEEQKEARRYYHGAFYTAEQLKILRDRHQPPLPWNRVAPKLNRRVGLMQRLRSDPKAFGKNPKSEQGAEIATQAIRYVLDANQFKALDPICCLQSEIDGIAGIQLVLEKGDQSDLDCGLHFVIGDEYFYDPTSYRFDFADNSYEGISKWLGLDAAIEMFPDHEETLRGLIAAGSDLTTNPDREIKWTMTTAQRVRIVEHWYKHRGKWCWAFYVNDILLEQGLSPFFDERGKAISSFVMFSRAIDQDGDRYGDVRNLKGPQDALNAGKSKTLHLANTKLVQATKGVVDDVEIARRELARPDGWVEVNPGSQNNLQIVDTKQDLAAFVQFTQEAKSELDQDADMQPAMMPASGIPNASGRAIQLLQQAGMAELGPFILSYRGWKLRLFRAIWNTVQRYWTKERWIRVSGDDGLAQFLQLNSLGLDQYGRPAIVNALGQLDVNIALDEGPDIAAMMQDTFDALKGYPPGAVPPAVLIELNPNIPRSDKNRVLQMMMPKPPPPDPAAAIVKRLQLEGLAADVAQKGAKVADTHASAEQKLATAQVKRAQVETESARAGHLATEAHLGAAEFARDSLLEAQKVERELQQPQQSAQPPQVPSPLPG